MSTDKLSGDDLAFLFGAKPEDAIAYLKRKGLRIAWNWHETLDAAHARSFTVAKVARVEILQALRTELLNTLNNGGTEKQFVDNLTPTLQKLGWWGKQIIVDGAGAAEVAQLGSPRRLKVIFRTNMQSAYMDGRAKSMAENIEAFPYWKYIAVLDGRTRQSHRALDGRIFHYKDGFSSVGMPPNGHNCRCRFVAMSERMVKREGIKPTVTDGILQTREVEAGIDKRTDEVRNTKLTGFYLKGADGKQIWVGPDAGFNSSPLASHLMDDVLVKRAAGLDKELALKQVEQTVLHPVRLQAWRSFIENTLDFGRQQGQTMTLGVMQAADIAYAKNKGAAIDSPIVFVQDKLIKSPKATRHEADGDALSKEDWLALPLLFAKAQLVVWDNLEQKIVYILPTGAGIGRLAVRYGRIKNELSLPDAATAYGITEKILEDYLKSGRFEKVR